jgi:hypothetical protein
MATASPYTQLFSSDPVTQQNAALIQQRMALSQALLQQGMTPLDTANRSVGGVGYAISPFEGLAKIMQSYIGQKGVEQGAKDQAGLAAQAYGNLLQKYQPQTAPSMSPGQVSGAQQGALTQGAAQGDIGPTVGNSARLAQALGQVQPANPGTPFNPQNPTNAPAELLAGAQGGMIPEKIAELLMKPYSPTAATQTAIQGGMPIAGANRTQFAKDTTDPKVLMYQQSGFSPEMINRILTAEAQKAVEIDRKPGNWSINALLGTSAITPKIPEYTNVVGQVSSNGAVPAVSLIPGAVRASAAVAGADAGARSSNTIMQIPGPGGSTLTGWGSQFAGGRGGGGGAYPDPGVPQPGGVPQSYPVTPVAPGVGGLPAAPNAGAGRGFVPGTGIPGNFGNRAGAAPGIPGAPPGFTGTVGQSTAQQVTSAESAKESVAAYNDLHRFATASAPRNIGLLDSISELADKTLAGPGASKVQFVNGVLNMFGIQPGADSAQNYQIAKKNLNMLVGSQRMASGSGGSDALQTLLEAANPDISTMNAPALKEAAAELKAYQLMMMAKDRAAPNPMTTTPQAYQQFETGFAKHADPRLWQMEHAANDNERSRILSLIPAAERAGFIEKAKAARAAGILN